MQTTKTKLILTFAAIVIVIIGTIVVVYFVSKITNTSSRIAVPAIVEPGFFAVTAVSDGDTIEVNMDGRTERVRMIGVDTPETKKPNSPVECYGQAASDYSKKILSGQAVRLVADPKNQNRDRYNRLLRYVYLTDGSLHNAELIKNGYGFAYLSFPFTKATEFKKYQSAAQDAGMGLWAGECETTNQSGRFKTNPL